MDVRFAKASKPAGVSPTTMMPVQLTMDDTTVKSSHVPDASEPNDSPLTSVSLQHHVSSESEKREQNLRPAEELGAAGSTKKGSFGSFPYMESPTTSHSDDTIREHSYFAEARDKLAKRRQQEG